MQSEIFVLQEKTLGGLLDEAAEMFPDREAVIYFDAGLRRTWREFSRDVDDLAKGLMAMGLGPGDKAGIWAPNVPHWLTLMFAAARVGVILITVNTSYRDHELEYFLKQSDCDVLFMVDVHKDHDYLKILESVAPDLHDSPPEALKLASFPCLRRVINMGEERVRGLHCLKDVTGLAPGVSDAEYAARKALVSPHDVVQMQYTSGTTGFPKGVMLSHVNILNNGWWIGQNMRFTEQDRLCLCVPLFHCFGTVLGVMASVCHRTTMVVVEVFNPLKVLAAVQQERCTALHGVPSMFLSILEHRNFSRYDISALRTGIMAGSVCPVPLMRRAMDDMHLVDLTNCYGLTEASPVMSQTTADDDFRRKTETVGRPMPGVEVRVADPELLPEKVVEVPRGEQGELVCRGYNIMKGYYKMPEATAEVLNSEGWLRSGDLGCMDEEDYIVINGRVKDMIIKGGENIYPREIENFLLRMEKVFDVQVVGVPSRRYGEDVVAFIIPKEGETVTRQDVRDYCRGRIAWHKVPRYIAFVDSYPMTGSKKIQKYLLRQKAEELFGKAAQG
ncbi:MAG: AMP-binding protein [Desulfovibrio sp.]|jgi:fatty-acyl-CoA synthase|nr:AMP-binding protein [Desulfovibrio sp.]